MGMLLWCLLALPLLGVAQIQGVVRGHDGTPLIGATVWVTPVERLLVTGTGGRFALDGLPDGGYELTANYLGYQPLTMAAAVVDGRCAPLTLTLAVQGVLLADVVVTEEHAKQERTLATEHFGEQLLERNLQGTFAKAIEKLPGISAINVGVGIAKPVIRGLSFNRIIVNQQGIKQEGQQWGADHGLELDPFDVERVEIVKGPASLQYGSDGLGGVINIMPGRVPPRNSLSGSVQGVHKTNNGHWGGSAKLALNRNDVFVSARYSLQDFGDYRVPADQFTYNGFTLPIANRALKNTAGREQNTSLGAGVLRPWGVSRLLFSHYRLAAGLFAGAVGIPRAYALEDDGNPRDIDTPSQQVDHYKLSYHLNVHTGTHSHFDLNVGYQHNLRREFSFPEFHNIPTSQRDAANTLALQLALDTYSANAHYEYRPSAEWKTVLGASTQWQRNRHAGFQFLLPGFRTFRGGVFALAERHLGRGAHLNGGLRLDYATNATDFFRQRIWNSNEVVIDSLVAPVTGTEHLNWSASLGASLPLRGDAWLLKANLGKSFRVPYPAETVSNGIHHGTFRHEVGTPDLRSEHGYQLDVSTELRLPRFRASVATYFNYFDNFIYLGPTFPAQFSPLPEAGQLFQYRQDDALYTGFELQWAWTLLPGLTLEQTADWVQSYNLTTGLALPFTPQPTAKHTLLYEVERSGRRVEEWYAEVGHEYYFAAEGPRRVDRSERPTPATHLWHLGAGCTLAWPSGRLVLGLQVQNLFDVFYLNHLSRYRLLNVPEQGRNVVLSVKVPFVVGWDKAKGETL